jgi:staphylococcal nuclease domain-containing protein 1
LHEHAAHRVQIWGDYDEDAEAQGSDQPANGDDQSALKTNYLDIIISDIRISNTLAFSVQILNTEGPYRAPLSKAQDSIIVQASLRWKS